MSRLAGVLLVVLLLGVAVADVPAPLEESPHAEAIRLVMRIRAHEVQALDQAGEWWHDTTERAWTARRPIAPGIMDSTHYFEVAYRIDGKLVGRWSVNTRSGVVVKFGEPIQSN